ncbi:peptidase [Klebsiella pneumoniae]|uniref:Peptidase n=1 Tax=Klebsiella pneumoniae TaxID=573 RepID=A0A378BDP4_KLEPN|nr:peptidase [Klebsiella pneumoniae]
MVQESRCVKGSILLNHRLEKEYVEDDFHIFYSLQGRDALKYQYDSSGSGVPDSIKDIAGQLQAAKYLYSSVLGLRFPLQQKIYAQARQINVYVLQLPKGNGLAFDRVAAETMSDGRQLPCGLKFVLNAALEPARNITPAHEFFHLYQYGYAVFKQKWYLEGMARWMENSFKAPEKNTRRLSPLPHCDSNFYPRL